MCDDADKYAGTDLLGELSELGSAIKPLLRRLPGVRKAIDRLTGGLTSKGAKALASRLDLYRTGSLVSEAQKVADATGLPTPTVFDSLVRQRGIDELTMDALKLVAQSHDNPDDDTANAEKPEKSDPTDRWFHTFYQEAGAVNEEDMREAFVRILAGEIQNPGSFSLRTLRMMSAVSQSTATHFRSAASVSIRLTLDGTRIMDARIPAIGGKLGTNCLQNDGLSYDVLTDMTENGLVHSDYSSYHPYGPLELQPDVPPLPLHFQIPFIHQGKRWLLLPEPRSAEAKPVLVSGAKLTSCGIESLTQKELSGFKGL